MFFYSIPYQLRQSHNFLCRIWSQNQPFIASNCRVWALEILFASWDGSIREFSCGAVSLGSWRLHCATGKKK
jgi:hypothetical protein